MSKFKVGDSVYDIRHGSGEVISNSKDHTYGIEVLLPVGRFYYTTCGRAVWRDKNPILLTIEEAMAKGYDVLKVKRKVTKTISRWANVYPDCVTCNDYYSKEEADSRANLSDRIACVELTGTYEVEEEE